eukprot:2317521-Pleurochrysis_carterae.AAC.4
MVARVGFDRAGVQVHRPLWRRARALRGAAGHVRPHGDALVGGEDLLHHGLAERLVCRPRAADQADPADAAVCAVLRDHADAAGALARVASRRRAVRGPQFVLRVALRHVRAEAHSARLGAGRVRCEAARGAGRLLLDGRHERAACARRVHAADHRRRAEHDARLGAVPLARARGGRDRHPRLAILLGAKQASRSQSRALRILQE